MGQRVRQQATQVSAVVVAAVMLAACGGGESTDTTTAPTTLPSSTVAASDDPGTTAAPDAVVPELGGTSWDVTLYQEEAAMVNLWPGTEITVSFGIDGTVAGSGGCNDYTGTFEVEGPYNEFAEGVRDEEDGQTILIELASVTERACTSPSGVMDQESAYLSALESSGRWLIGREAALLLRTSDGFFLVEAQPAA